jgi:hypothetical protein
VLFFDALFFAPARGPFFDALRLGAAFFLDGALLFMAMHGF